MTRPPRPAPRSVAVIDVGATNLKAALLDGGLNPLAERRAPAPRRAGPPYESLDPEPLIAFAREAILAFDRIAPVDSIVTCAHGSAFALLDAAGGLALPPMSYEAVPPPEIAAGYAAIEPPFSEVFAPTNPGALTAARQLYWQETAWPEAFARVRTILPWAQYAGWRLSGVAAGEISALGAQTHLWRPRGGGFSALAEARGWARRFAPARPAWAPLGPVRGMALRGRGEVLTGVHDSNANLLCWLGQGLTLLSTGTWMIGFAPGVGLDRLDPARDQVANVTVFGEQVASFRFMMGREYAAVGGDAAPDLGDAAALVAEGVRALPSFSDSGGPAPGTGGRRRIVGEPGARRGSLAALYCAQMAALALEAAGVRGAVVVDGPFAANPVFLALLAALAEGCEVYASRLENGTVTGAALLALFGPEGERPDFAPPRERVAAASVPGLAEYHRAWRPG